MKKIIIASALMLAATTSSFGAVKGGKVGVNFQYSGTLPSLGVWWHLTDMIAINPYVGYDFSSTKDVYTGTTLTCGAATCTQTDKSNTLTLGIDIPLYVAQFNALNLFIAPGFGYKSASGSTVTENSTASTSLTVDKGSTSTLAFGLAAGLQIAVLDQLHVFGKAGFDLNIASNSASSNYSRTQFTTGRASIGAIFYFN